MKFSVILVTYNSDMERIRLTLKSVLSQRFKDYEIVISDDGSRDNHFGEIEEYFKEEAFTNYVLVPHEKNQGTVKNLISALTHAGGTYVRDFGPGDLFYNENSLEELYSFFEKNRCEMCFGLMRGYTANMDGSFSFGDFYHPFDIEAYRKKKYNRVKKNLLLYSDNVSGACLCYTRELYLKYLKKIEDTVIYEEDIFQVMAVLDGVKPQLFDDYLVWYEMAAGVSTKKKSKFEELLAKDVDRFYTMLSRHYDDKYVIKRKKLSGFYRIKNLYLRTALRCFVNPDAVRYLISSFVERKTGKHKAKNAEKGFLEDKDYADKNVSVPAAR